MPGDDSILIGFVGLPLYATAEEETVGELEPTPIALLPAELLLLPPEPLPPIMYELWWWYGAPYV